jgi:hypothetical protein
MQRDSSQTMLMINCPNWWESALIWHVCRPGSGGQLVGETTTNPRRVAQGVCRVVADVFSTVVRLTIGTMPGRESSGQIKSKPAVNSGSRFRFSTFKPTTCAATADESALHENQIRKSV